MLKRILKQVKSSLNKRGQIQREIRKHSENEAKLILQEAKDKAKQILKEAKEEAFLSRSRSFTQKDQFKGA